MNLRFSFWLLSFLGLLGFSYYTFELGWFHYIWAVDISKLTFVNLGILYAMYARLGVLLFLREGGREVSDEDIDPGYEAADTATNVGMLGTVIGFIIMAYSLATADLSNVENIKQLFGVVATGMATALYTTASGLVTSIILRTSHYVTKRLS